MGMAVGGPGKGKIKCKLLLPFFFLFYYLVSSKPLTTAFSHFQWWILIVQLLHFLNMKPAREQSFPCLIPTAQPQGRGSRRLVRPPHGLPGKGTLRRKGTWSSKQATKSGGSESTLNPRERKWTLFANRRRREGGGSTRERQAESQGP